jgi:hypothetical protein
MTQDHARSPSAAVPEPDDPEILKPSQDEGDCRGDISIEQR